MSIFQSVSTITMRLVFIPLQVLFIVNYLMYATPESRNAMFMAFSLGVCLMGEMWKSKYYSDQ